MSKSIYEIITERIIDQLNKGIVPWHKPWTGGLDGAYNYVSGKAYSVLNQMLLSHADAYLSWKQIQDLGGKVKKGAKSEIVTFWKVYPIEEEDKDGNKIKKNIPLLRYYQVFWIGDVDGIERKEVERVAHDPIKEAEAIVNGYMTSKNHPTLERDNISNRAYYSPMIDKVVVPSIEQFKEVAEYYSTLFHELTHSTGHATRLNRLTMTAHFGNEEYSKEELVAEIGAATLTNMAGIETSSSFNNSAAYIQGWSKALKDNVKMIVEASSKAGKAVDYILQNKPETTDDAGEKAPAKETKKASRKSNEQRAFNTVVKSSQKIHSSFNLSGTYKSEEGEVSYACDSFQVMKTTVATSEAPEDIFYLNKVDADRFERMLTSTDFNKVGTITITAKELKEGIKATKNGKRNAKVLYTDKNGFTFNPNFLYNALLATGATEYKYNSKSGHKSPVLFVSDTTTYLLCPIHVKGEKNAEGFKLYE